MCRYEFYPVISPKSAFFSIGVRRIVIAACAALAIILHAGCATMPKPQQEAAWRTLARSTGAMAAAFSPEARMILTVACASSRTEAALRDLWVGLDSHQAGALVQMINDTVALAEAYMGEGARDKVDFYKSILDAICLGASVGG